MTAYGSYLSVAIVYIVDDDALVRDSLQLLIKSVGLKAESFSSAQAFLDTGLSDNFGCLVLDIRMPGLSGLDLQNELAKRGSSIPIIFITGHGTVPMSVRAMKAGAVDFLQKPFEDQELLDVIQLTLEQDRHARLKQAEVKQIEQHVESLTLREHEILVRVVAGMLNKVIAFELNISENTVKTHRAHIMQKMAVTSLADLVRVIEKIDMPPPQNTYSKN